ncbi:hypothetical protein KIN20_000274 [Parelaphostrongylus tenuis]|uniref:Uncharacterized protein n=1 Tax=Parelaphostrongylus tenuis TaxID=148309 RepID=A0AAD5QFG3_PARTN|nr:hypothetical protein KIN20_000274 [Parelaphostrongylus tenuis]
MSKLKAFTEVDSLKTTQDDAEKLNVDFAKVVRHLKQSAKVKKFQSSTSAPTDLATCEPTQPTTNGPVQSTTSGPVQPSAGFTYSHHSRYVT